MRITVEALLQLTHRWIARARAFSRRELFPRWQDDEEYQLVAKKPLTDPIGSLTEADVAQVMDLARAEFAERRAAVDENGAKIDRLITLSLTMLGALPAISKALDLSYLSFLVPDAILLATAAYLLFARQSIDIPSSVSTQDVIAHIKDNSRLSGIRLTQFVVDSMEVASAGQHAVAIVRSKQVRNATLSIFVAIVIFSFSAAWAAYYWTGTECLDSP